VPLHISEISIRVAVESAADDLSTSSGSEQPDATELTPHQEERIVSDTMRRVLLALKRSERR
jgi:hypothetical protein